MKLLFPKTPPRALPLILLGVFCLLSLGCKVEVVSVPSSIEVGQDAQFILRIHNDSVNDGNENYLVARIPAGWSLVSASYESNTNPPETGVLVPSLHQFSCLSDQGGAGYQSLILEPDPIIHAPPGYSALVRLVFHINSTPAGPYRTWFRFYSPDGGNYSHCSNKLVSTWNRAIPLNYRLANHYPIEFQEPATSPADAVKPPAVIDSSVYVADHNRLLVFRQHENGNLVFSGEMNHSDHPDWGLDYCNAASGQNPSHSDTKIYVACNYRTLVLAHDDGDLLPHLQQRLDLESGSPTLYGISAGSPGGNTVARNDHHSTILYNTTDHGGITDLRYLDPQKVFELGPQEKFAYGGSSSLRVYDIQVDPAVVVQTVSSDDIPTPFGALTDIAVRPDGRFLYVSSDERRNITLFSRDLNTGFLTYLATVSDSDDPQTLGLNYPKSIEITRDGETLFAISSSINGISFFDIDPNSGLLTHRNLVTDGDRGFGNLRGVRKAKRDPYNGNIFATTHNSLINLAPAEVLLMDGFESGDLSGWSSTNP